MKRYNITWVTILAMFATGACATTEPAGEWDRLRAEERVFAATLDSLFASTKNRILVRNTTSAGATREHLPFDFPSRAKFPSLVTETLEDFLTRNQEPREIQHVRNTDLAVEVVDDSVIANLPRDVPPPPHDSVSQDPSEFWRAFGARFGEGTPLVVLSRPGFDPHRTQAFLVATYGCGALCAASYHVLLRRDADDWRVVEMVQIWVS